MSVKVNNPPEPMGLISRLQADLDRAHAALEEVRKAHRDSITGHVQMARDHQEVCSNLIESHRAHRDTQEELASATEALRKMREELEHSSDLMSKLKAQLLSSTNTALSLATEVSNLKSSLESARAYSGALDAHWLVKSAKKLGIIKMGDIQ